MTDRSDNPVDDVPPDARRAIERAVWDWGVQGDSCAILASDILGSLYSAGFKVARRAPTQNAG